MFYDIMHLLSEGTLVAVLPEYADLNYCAMGPGFNIWSNTVLIKNLFFVLQAKVWKKVLKKEKYHTRLKCDSNELTYTF